MSKRLLLFDFDETYFKHNTNEERFKSFKRNGKIVGKTN